MADSRLANSIKAFLTGRVIAIAVIAIVSSASFALGFFVGKVLDGESMTEAVSPASAPEEYPIEGVKEDAPPPMLPTVRERPVTANIPLENDKPSGPSPAVSGDNMPSDMPVDEEAPPPAPKRQEEKPVGAPANKRMEQTAAAPAYSVQVGAYKSLKDAEGIQRKLKGKGYGAYILKTFDSSQQAIFKVRIGHFIQKSAADVLALKLNKTEGEKAFVADSE